MKPRMKRLKTYEQFLTDNPTWFEDEFPQFATFDLATFKSIVELWFKYRYLCCYDEEKFKVYFKRRILEELPRWAELTDLETMRPLKATWDELSKYNDSTYNLDSTTERTDNTDVKNTGTVQNSTNDSTTMGQTMTTDGTKSGTKANTGTQGTVRTTEREDTHGGNIITTDTGTQTNTSKNTGTQSTSDSLNDVAHSTTSGSANSDNRSLATNLPQSITSDTATFESHFSGETDDSKGHKHIDSEGNVYYDNPQAGWHTANAKSEAKNTSSSNGTTDSTDSQSNNSIRTDDLTQTDEREDNLEREVKDRSTLNSDTTDNATRTDNLNEETSDTNHSVTAYGGTNTKTGSGTTTNNLDTLTTGTGKSTTGTNYTTGGRTNHNPSEIILTALQNITKFCSTEWLYLKLQPCFLLFADDFDDDIEWVEDSEWTDEDLGGLIWRT